MIHVTIDYTGIIPGLGRGPFTNIPISNTAYSRLKAIGYPIKVLNSNTIVRKVSAKKVTPITNTNPSVTLTSSKSAKPETVEAVAPAEINKTTVVEKPKKEVVEEPKIEAVVEPEVTTEVTEQEEAKVLSAKDLDNMTKEELDKLLYVYTTDRPSRYGKPWLIKKLKEVM